MRTRITPNTDTSGNSIISNTSVYEIKVSGENNMSQEGEGTHPDNKKWFKELKDYFRIILIILFPYISEFQKMLSEGNFEYQVETFNAL